MLDSGRLDARGRAVPFRAAARLSKLIAGHGPKVAQVRISSLDGKSEDESQEPRWEAKA